MPFFLFKASNMAASKVFLEIPRRQRRGCGFSSPSPTIKNRGTLKNMIYSYFTQSVFSGEKKFMSLACPYLVKSPFWKEVTTRNCIILEQCFQNLNIKSKYFPTLMHSIQQRSPLHMNQPFHPKISIYKRSLS